MIFPDTSFRRHEARSGARGGRRVEEVRGAGGRLKRCAGLGGSGLDGIGPPVPLVASQSRWLRHIRCESIVNSIVGSIITSIVDSIVHSIVNLILNSTASSIVNSIVNPFANSTATSILGSTANAVEIRSIIRSLFDR